jgi:hypothetical protein
MNYFNVESRNKVPPGSAGPFIATVVNNLDPTYSGMLEVVINTGIKASSKNSGNYYVVKYLSPFYGATSIEFEGSNSSDFNDVQKSYGFWAVPPDIGVKVMVIFIDGDQNQGYWIGCVQSQYQNHMVPGLAASKSSAITQEQKRKYGTEYLPVAEFLKSTQKLENSVVGKIPKPVHPFAERLLAQGLLLDVVRGTTSSSARREVPSTVFGISTPGPIDKSPGAKKGLVGSDNSFRSIPVSRLGGSSFVMDDGDSNGQNELIRIRTRTGHQILLHNTHDLIYIGNSKGTAWVELTSNGKIDIFAQDSVSIHSENDFNFRADRDINIEAGRNINIKSLENMDVNVFGNHNLIVKENLKVLVLKNKDESIGANLKIKVDGNFDLKVEGHNYQTSGGSHETKAGGNIVETAPQIHMNGPVAAEAAVTELPEELAVFELPNRKTVEGWADGNFYKADPLESIMLRVPTHEPWDHHENVNSSEFTPESIEARRNSSK